ncbi:uncharacterized protein MONOS_9931fu9932 [Monocercomonoides exilis]|uniref:uncharacterized protein n=1 Tax=Monocercomonoides exilis TaxID=2049356 RepID=UPI00355AB390|nr:hypothetical protein MONOS_9931fu9932 [Monocercomonoides exilis]
MSGCTVKCVESPYNGGLFHALNSKSFAHSSANTSFENCHRRHNAIPMVGDHSMIRQNISAGDATFVDCEFNSLESDYGGAIRFTSTGGAIDMCTPNSFLIRNTITTNCTTGHVGSGMITYDCEDTGLIDSCVFEGCKKKTQDYQGGCFGLYAKGRVNMTDCCFRNCSSEKHGGGICWDNSSNAYVSKVSFCFFENNSAAKMGHDVYIDSGWTNINEECFVLCRSATASSANRVMKGIQECSSWIPNTFFDPILVNSASGIDHQACGSADVGDIQGRRCRTVGYAVGVANPLLQTKAIAVEECVCHETRIDVCTLTISFSGAGADKTVLSADATGSTALVQITTGSATFSSLAFRRNASASLHSHLFHLTDMQGCLEVAHCTITATETLPDAPFAASVITVAAGHVLFDSVEIGPMCFSSVAALAVNAEAALSVTLTSTNLTAITRQSGSGSGLDCSLIAGSQVCITGGSFSSCTACQDGSCGGGVCAHLTDEDAEMVVNGSAAFADCCVPDTEGTGGTGGTGGKGGGMMVHIDNAQALFQISSGVCFSDSTPNRAAVGRDLFLRCAGRVMLSEIVNTTTLQFVDHTQCFADPSRLSGSEDGADHPVIPLEVYLCHRDNNIYVDGLAGTDHLHCGPSVFACETIHFAASNRITSASTTILLAANSTLASEITIETLPFLLSSATAHLQAVRVHDAGQCSNKAIVTASAEMSASSICFLLPTAMSTGRHGFIHSLAALTLDHCCIDFHSAPSLPVTFYIMHLASGSATITNTQISTHAEFSTFTPILISGAHSITINSTTIARPRRANGDGGCLIAEKHTQQGTTMHLSNCTISSCCIRAHTLKGGSLYASVENGRKLTMTGVTFTQCSASSSAPEADTDSDDETEAESEEEVDEENEDTEERGLGGGMFIEGGEGSMDFVLQNMTFDKCHAWRGKSLFVAGQMLDSVADTLHLKWDMDGPAFQSLHQLNGWERATCSEHYAVPLVVYLWTNFSAHAYVDGADGWDFSACGFDVAPCRSIDKALQLRFAPDLPSSASTITVTHSTTFSSLLHLQPSATHRNPQLLINGNIHGTPVAVHEPALQGSNKAFLASSILLRLANLSFSLPPSLHSILSFLQSATSSARLSLSACSFASTAPSSPTSYAVASVLAGSVEIANCCVSAITLTHPFFLVAATASQAAVQNLSACMVDASPAGIIEVAAPAEDTSKQTISPTNSQLTFTIADSNFTNITAHANHSTVFALPSYQSIDCVLDSCFCTNCVGETIDEGGAVRVRLSSTESSLKVASCVLTQCVCSRTKGKGGALMIDCTQPQSHSQSYSQSYSQSSPPAPDDLLHPIPLRILNDRFILNDAFSGKDIFIRSDHVATQINETQFTLDFTQPSLQTNNSICGSTFADSTLLDLIPLITFFKAGQIHACLLGTDSRQCGSTSNMCRTIDNSIRHIGSGTWNMVVVHTDSAFARQTTLADLTLRSATKLICLIHLQTPIAIEQTHHAVVAFANDCSLDSCHFSIGSGFSSELHSVFCQLNGSLLVVSCTFTSAGTETLLNSTLVSVASGVFEMRKAALHSIATTRNLLLFCSSSVAVCTETNISSTATSNAALAIEPSTTIEIRDLAIRNSTADNAFITCGCPQTPDTEPSPDEPASLLKLVGVAVAHATTKRCGFDCTSCTGTILQHNCSFTNFTSTSTSTSTPTFASESASASASASATGTMEHFANCENIQIEACIFQGTGTAASCTSSTSNTSSTAREVADNVCTWNGSLVHFADSSVAITDAAFTAAPQGALSLSAASAHMHKILFANNTPSIPNYQSARRNIICSNASTLHLTSIAGGDGLLPNTSLWIHTTACSLHGIPAQRASSFFIPTLTSAAITHHNNTHIQIRCNGSLLLPCNLSYALFFLLGDQHAVEKGTFSHDDYVSENEIASTIPANAIADASDKADVLVALQFGNPSSPSFTDAIVVKNKSESQANGNEKLVEGGKEGKSYWLLIVIVLVAILLIVLICFIIFVIRWRKQKRRTEELEEIVNDNIKKDPKAFEMVTMEMSPEEQWRRAEREAEKKNEERIKKRVYEKSLGHSESSEHLLSDSGSTEYILGKDSDKIPEWMLEKVDEKEEEEIRKRTLSPSISSTSTTDSDSTFVRSESLCPTTSSMSNLVDAMACSSPHEKLIVDLRDSLFMLLHGKNEKKEMAIGTLREREQTAAQILFWVAGGALFSFEDGEDDLPSLPNLSPHIVLFSEHMVICIALHSDCSSEDSDTSSISSSTVVTSASDDDDDDDGRNDRDSLPSSAFEEEDSFKKECLRWKAPELLINKNMGATQKSVAFSIGMMLWECVTLQIPFGKYEAETAGQKIANGEKPDLGAAGCSAFAQTINACLSQNPDARPSPAQLQRQFIQHFPGGAPSLTASDALYCYHPLHLNYSSHQSASYSATTFTKDPAAPS